MRFAISIPQFYSDGDFDPAAFRAYFTRAEELGFDSAWTQEQMLGAAPQLGPIETMTYAAACTQRLRLGCVVFVSTLHSPVHLAKSLSSLDQLSGGRTEIGVGTGGPGRPFAAFGVDPQRYVARFTEGLALMKALWTESRVTFDGEFWQLKDAAMEPKPVQKPFPPIWFGGAGATALRRATGWAAASSAPDPRPPPSSPARSRSCARRWPAGGPAGEFRIAKRVYIAIDETPGGRAAGSTPSWSGSTGAAPRTSRPPRSRAPPTTASASCARSPTAGAELILFTPMFEQAEHAERLALQVIPRLG